MTALRDALIANREILGTGFEKLGKRNRIYLSYDKIAGWSVVQFKGILGYFQEFCRRYLGFYASTHWKHVHQAYRKIDATRMNLPHSFCVKIDRCARHALCSHRKNRSSFQFFIEHPQKNQICAQIGPAHVSIERGALSRTKGVEAVVATSNVQEEIAQAVGSDREDEFRRMIEAVEGEEIAVVNAGSLSNSGIQKILICPLRRPDASFNPTLLLRDLYHRILDAAFGAKIRSIAFSFAGIEREETFTAADAAAVALDLIEQYTSAHPERFDKIKFVVSESDYVKVRDVCHSMADLRRGT